MNIPMRGPYCRCLVARIQLDGVCVVCYRPKLDTVAARLTKEKP